MYKRLESFSPKVYNQLMLTKNSIRHPIPWTELDFSAVRSTGAGGQNVNKTNSAVLLRWNLLSTLYYSLEKLEILKTAWAHRLTTEGDLLIRCERSRDQLANKKECVEKLMQMIQIALTPKKVRRPTKPTRSSQRKRVNSKKIHAEKKKLRGRIQD